MQRRSRRWAECHHPGLRANGALDFVAAGLAFHLIEGPGADVRSRTYRGFLRAPITLLAKTTYY